MLIERQIDRYMEINEYTDRKIDKYREREGNNEIHRVCVRDRERFRH